jgi:uncharacterized membrane protein
MNRYILSAVIFFSLFAAAFGAETGTIIADQSEIVKAKVLEVVKESEEVIAGTAHQALQQSLRVQILEGSNNGKIVTIDNDYIRLKEGELFYLMHNTQGENGLESYAVSGPYRLPAIFFFGGLFILLTLLIGGWQGLRGLISLAGSLLLIIYMLLPGILAGYSPVLVAIGVSSLIIIIGSYVTHGFNKTTSSAVFGMIITVIITGLLAFWSVNYARLTGYSSEEVSYLVLNSRGQIDIVGILLGGMMIGVLGILYDVAIGQAIAVEELHTIAPHVGRNKIYWRAMRMGREHIGALVNTLAIAYVGVSLPVLLLFTQFETSLTEMINREIFTTEIIRTFIGSIGLMLAVPITTLLAVFILVKRSSNPPAEVLVKENDALKTIHHHH